MRYIAGLAVLSVLILSSPAFSATATDYRLEKRVALDPGGRLVVDAEATGIDVRGGTEPGAHVVLTSRDPKFESRYTVDIAESPGLVRVTIKKKDLESGSGWLRSERGAELAIVVPRRTSVELDTSGGGIKIAALEGEARADTSGGSIDLSDVRGNATLETSGGSIKAVKVSGALTAETSGGSIRAAEVAGDATLETSGGSIEASEMGGRLVCATSGGSIEASFARGNAKGGTLETSGGGIRVRLDPAVGLQLKAKTTGGSLSHNLPLSASEQHGSALTGTLGSGGALLEVETTGGSIRIEGIATGP